MKDAEETDGPTLPDLKIQRIGSQPHVTILLLLTVHTTERKVDMLRVLLLYLQNKGNAVSLDYLTLHETIYTHAYVHTNIYMCIFISIKSSPGVHSILVSGPPRDTQTHRH